MGWRFRRSIGLGPVRINISKSGVGMSAGAFGQRVALRPDGRIVQTNSLPGTGISHQQSLGRVGGNVQTYQQGPTATSGGSGCAIVFAVCAGIFGVLLFVVGITTGSLGIGIFGGIWLAACTITIVVMMSNAASARRLAAEQLAQQQRAWELAEWNRQEQERAAHQAALEAAARYRAMLFDRFGDAQIVEKIVAHEIWQGATAEMIHYSRGEPADVATSVLKTKTKETWKYDRIYGNHFALRVHFENGVCVGWETN